MSLDPLDGTRWALEYISLGGISHMVNGRRIPEIAFVDGRVSADDGVNLAEGTYSWDGNIFDTSVSATTSLHYPDEVLPEYDLFEHLAEVRSAVMHGDFLHLRFGRSTDELVYRYEAEGAPA
ncbi:MAG: META domain-containing protein [Microthrixaceae bacterium]